MEYYKRKYGVKITSFPSPNRSPVEKQAKNMREMGEIGRKKGPAVF